MYVYYVYIYIYIRIYIYIYIHTYSESQTVGNTFCNPYCWQTWLTYSEVLSSVGFIPTLFTALQTSLPARVRNLFHATLVPLVPPSVSIAFAVHAGGWGVEAGRPVV